MGGLIMEWSQKGLPHKGWIYCDVEDTGCLSSTCEMCGNTIRYVHYLSHPNCTMKIGVGCICAEKLTDDYVTPKEREKSVKKPPKAQLLKWVTNGWKISSKGNLYKRVNKLVIVISCYPSGFGVYIKDNQDNREYKNYNFETEEMAKYASFDLKREILKNRKTDDTFCK